MPPPMRVSMMRRGMASARLNPASEKAVSACTVMKKVEKLYLRLRK